MQRQRLLAIAGALSITAFATTVGLGANFGLFGITEPDSGVGRLDTSRPALAVPAVHPARAVAAAPATVSATALPPTTLAPTTGAASDAAPDD